MGLVKQLCFAAVSLLGAMLVSASISLSLFLTAALARRTVDYSPRFRGVCVIHCAFLGWLALVALKELFTTHPLYLSILGHGAKRARSSNLAPKIPAIYILCNSVGLQVQNEEKATDVGQNLSRPRPRGVIYYGVLIQQELVRAVVCDRASG